MLLDAFTQGVWMAVAVIGFTSVMMTVLLIAAFIGMLASGKIRIEDYKAEDGGTQARAERRTTAQKQVRRK